MLGPNKMTDFSAGPDDIICIVGCLRPTVEVEN